MSIHKENGKHRVKWEQSGRQRSKTFERKGDAETYEREIKRAKQLDNAYRQIEILPPSRQQKRRDANHVYVIAGGDRVKIGIASDPRRRLTELSTASAFPLALMRTIDTDRAAELEATLHARYAAHRHHGEWFDAEPVLADLMPCGDDELIALIRKERAA